MYHSYKSAQEKNSTCSFSFDPVRSWPHMMVHSKGNDIMDWIFAISKEKICICSTCSSPEVNLSHAGNSHSYSFSGCSRSFFVPMKESFSIALAGPGPANPPGIPKLPVSAINSPIARPFCTPFILCTTGDADNIMEVGPSLGPFWQSLSYRFSELLYPSVFQEVPIT